MAAMRTVEEIRSAYREVFGVAMPVGLWTDGLEVVPGGLLASTDPALGATYLTASGMRCFLGQPPGFLLTGFWGHGINSHAYYYLRVDAWSRIYFRLPHGGVYMDNRRQRVSVREFLFAWFEFEARAREELVRLQAVESMGVGSYHLSHRDGRELVLGRSFFGRPRFAQRLGGWLDPA